MSELIALLDGNIVGCVSQKLGRLGFIYDDAWRTAPGAYPLSTSMPVIIQEHGHKAVSAFLWGLLPDNAGVLERWARKFQVSARNPFALISNVGEDCAGAVQFIRPERLDALLDQTESSAVQWLTEAEIAHRLRAVKLDASAGRVPGDTGQFSLAGAQPKTALLLDEGRWGVPSGRVPTTHILKPPTGDFDGFAENEHLCLSLAKSLGLVTAKSEIQTFEDTHAIVIERYDRRRIVSDNTSNLVMRSGEVITRVHQEDYCQALSVHPENKYQNVGGPGPEQIIEHLRTHTARLTPPDADITRFRDALIFNWLIGGTDAHAKNYSILIGAKGKVRLAPLYDMASILAYEAIDPRKATLAMKIGDAYRLSKITGSEWAKFAKRNRLSMDAVIRRIQEMAAQLPDALSDEIQRMNNLGVSHPVLAKLSEVLIERSQRVSRL